MSLFCFSCVHRMVFILFSYIWLCFPLFRMKFVIFRSFLFPTRRYTLQFPARRFRSLVAASLIV
jgi:hypothetical protein